MQNCDNYEHFVTGNPHFSRMLSYNTSSNSLGTACQDKNIAAQILLFVVIFSLILNLCSLVPRYILQFASRKLKSKNKKTQNLVEYYNTCSVTQSLQLLRNIIYSKGTVVTSCFFKKNQNCFRGTLQKNAFVCFDLLSYEDYLIRFVKRNQAEKIFKA